MKIIQSTDSRTLISSLISDYKNTVKNIGPFDHYHIVVPSQSIQNHLQQEIVKQTGISSGIEFINIHQFLQSIHRAVMGEEIRYLDKSLLSALLFQILSEIKTGQVNFESISVIKDWLTECPEDNSLASLSFALADVFELYQIYRCDYLNDWQNHKKATTQNSEEWQSALWRLLLDRLDDNMILHKSHSINILEKAQDSADLKQLLNQYKKLIIVGGGQIDELTLKQLKLLSAGIDMTYLAHTPSTQLFGHEAQDKNKEKVKEIKPYFTGNTLLAACGTQNRAQQLLLSAYSNEIEYKSPEEAPETTVSTLQNIKNQIRNNTNAEDVFKPDDKSIQVVSHYSHYREVEGLYDFILAQFNADKSLQPNDIIVYCSDIDAYAPFIKSVFESQPVKQQLPHQVCGLNRSAGDAINVMLEFLELPKTRYHITDVVSLFNYSSIKRKLSLSEGDFEIINNWIKAANINWGLDNRTLRQLGLPEYDRNTLESGLNRLLLGLSVNNKSLVLNEEIFYGVENVSALNAGLLSRLIYFVDHLTEWRDLVFSDNTVQNGRTIKDWCDALRGMTDKLLDVPLPERESLNNWYKLLAFIEAEHESDNESVYSYDYFLNTIKLKAEEEAEISGAYRYGKINIGAFGNLKGIPAKVVAILGLNEADFPRKPEVSSFDLTKTDPRYDDRNRTEQDKDAFLRAILDCENTLYLSYVGKDIQSNQTRNPSLPLQELLDYLLEDEEEQARLVRQHPMSLYSDQYTDVDSPLTTFQDISSSDVRLPGIDSKQDSALPEWSLPAHIDLKQLKAFLEDPAKIFFKERLGVYFPDIEEELQDHEPFEVNGLDKWLLTDAIIEQGIQSGEITDAVVAEMAEQFKAKGGMIHDKLLDDEITSCIANAQKIVDQVLKIKGDKQKNIKPLEIEVKQNNQAIKLVGDVSLFSTEDEHSIIQISQKSASETGPKYFSRAIFDAVVASEALSGSENQPTYLVCSGKTYQLNIMDTKKHLQNWVNLYTNVMSTPVAINQEVVKELKGKIDKGGQQNFQEIFEEVVSNNAEKQRKRDYSQAFKILAQDDKAVKQAESLFGQFHFEKPGVEPDDKDMPYWTEVKEEK